MSVSTWSDDHTGFFKGRTLSPQGVRYTNRCRHRAKLRGKDGVGCAKPTATAPLPIEAKLTVPAMTAF